MTRLQDVKFKSFAISIENHQYIIAIL